MNKLIKWFRDLGDVYTMTDWAREVKQMRLREYIVTKQINEILAMLVFKG